MNADTRNEKFHADTADNADTSEQTMCDALAKCVAHETPRYELILQFRSSSKAVERSETDCIETTAGADNEKRPGA